MLNTYIVVKFYKQKLTELKDKATLLEWLSPILEQGIRRHQQRQGARRTRVKTEKERQQSESMDDVCKDEVKQINKTKLPKPKIRIAKTRIGVKPLEVQLPSSSTQKNKNHYQVKKWWILDTKNKQPVRLTGWFFVSWLTLVRQLTAAQLPGPDMDWQLPCLMLHASETPSDSCHTFLFYFPLYSLLYNKYDLWMKLFFSWLRHLNHFSFVRII